MASMLASLGIDRLPPEEKLRLVGEILDDLADSSESPLTEAQCRELDRRIAILDAGETALSNWPEVEARLLARSRG